VSEHKVIEFDLLNNAKDSLRQAVELLVYKDIGTENACLKHVIISSAHCIELLGIGDRLSQNAAPFRKVVSKYLFTLGTVIRKGGFKKFAICRLYANGYIIKSLLLFLLTISDICNQCSFI